MVSREKGKSKKKCESSVVGIVEILRGNTVLIIFLETPECVMFQSNVMFINHKKNIAIK